MAMASSLSLPFFSIFFLAIFSSVNVPIAQGQENHVLVLDHSNFSETLSKHSFIVVKFYAPWCGACVRIAPEYEQAASILSTHDPEIVLAKIDITDDANKQLAEKFDIKGVPTIKIFRNGGKENQSYKGPRKAQGIAKNLIKQLGPASVEVRSVEDADNLVDETNGISIVGIFPKFSGQEFDNFQALAEKLRSDYSFGHTLDAKFLSEGDKSVTGPTLRLLKPFDERYADSQDFQVDAMKKFIEDGTIPDVTVFNTEPMNQAMISKFWQNENTKVMMFTNFSSELHHALQSKYREAAVAYKGEGLRMLLVDFETNGRFVEYFAVKGHDTPLILIEESNGRKYIKENIKPDQILNAFKEYKDGVLKPFVKSQPIPEVNNEPVKVVVADSFEEIVLNSGKNVLLEFYAPNCEYCEKLAPILEEVAITYKNDPEILITKMDAKANDVTNDNFKVRGYPTIYFKTSSGDVMQYLEDHNKEEILEFIEENRERIEKSTASSNSEEVEEEEDYVKDEL